MLCGSAAIRIISGNKLKKRIKVKVFFKKVEKSREILLKIKKYEDGKCYKITIKIEVKLKFWKLRRPCKIRTSSFREHTIPMTGVFTSMANSDNGSGGTIALLFWCAYFIPIGILSYRHFGKEKR